MDGPIETILLLVSLKEMKMNTAIISLIWQNLKTNDANDIIKQDTDSQTYRKIYGCEREG